MRSRSRRGGGRHATVWRASVLRGLPVYFVQDIETSYYPDDPQRRYEVLNSYRPEFRYLTISGWNREQLRELGLDAGPDSAGDRHRARSDRCRHPRAVTTCLLAVGRSNPLKNFPLTLAAWRRLPHPRPELWLFGSEPELASEPGIRYIINPSDAEVNELLNEATVFVQTSTHEGFCLPILESMATGGAVVCTDAHGNRDFCVDGENCLMPAANPAAVAASISRLLADSTLRSRLGRGGLATAARLRLARADDELERFMFEIARPRRIEPSTDVVPDPRRR